MASAFPCRPWRASPRAGEGESTHSWLWRLAPEPGAGGWAGGVFANPVIAGFYPDPSVCRAGDDYCLAPLMLANMPGS
ncbi:MAG: xylan 1,4-beta-xylosidase [Trebonia sp.]|nr:xylan 1,4-beta-xylosidase [Trebonia sp.]